MENLEILVISQDGVKYAIETKHINQILRVPEITKIVLTPKSILGISAVSGDIATVISVNCLLGNSISEANDKNRVLSLDGSSFSLYVEEVIDSIEVDSKDVERIEDSEDAIVAIIKTEDEIIQLISLELLFKEIDFKPLDVDTVKDNISAEDEIVDQDEYERFLLFKMGEELFSINIEYLNEIIVVPQNITAVAGSSKELIGITSLRGDLRAIMDLRTFYSFKEYSCDKNRVIIIKIGDDVFGVKVDEILNIKDFNKKNIDTLPQHFQDKKISGIVHDDDQLISLLDEYVFLDWLGENRKFLDSNTNHEEKKEAQDVVLEVLTFKIADEEYAFNIDEIDEIIDYTKDISIAQAPEGIRGLINIRGQVVPIGSLHNRLGKELELGEDKKIVVCTNDDKKIGFYVDHVNDVMNIYKNELKASSDDDALFTNVLHLEDGERLVMLLNINEVYSKGQV